MKRIFKSLLDEVFSGAEAVFDKTDQPSFPIKSKILSTVFYEFCRESRDTLLGNDRAFLDFAMFAFANSCFSYSDSCQDLMVVYHLREMRCGFFVEIGDGVPLIGSNTALLEAKYGWNGIIYEKFKPNIDSLEECRKANIYYYDAIYWSKACETNTSEGVQGHDLYVPIHQRGATKRENSNLCRHVDFLSISLIDPMGALRSLDFGRENISILQVRHDWSNIHEIIDYLKTKGFNAWLPEFTGTTLLFIADNVITNPKHFFDSLRPSESFNAPSGRSGDHKIEILSIHLPKTGGSSLIEGLKSHFGKSYYEDWNHIPGHPLHNVRMPLTVGSNIKAVHGHLRAESYIGLNPRFIFTFIRDPAELVISSYYYLLNLSPGDNFEHSRLLKERPSIYDFAKYWAKGYFVYFAGLDAAIFDFIGRFEDYNNELDRLEGIIGVCFPRVQFNKSPENDERTLLLSDSCAMNKIRDSLRSEYLIYENLRARAF